MTIGESDWASKTVSTAPGTRSVSGENESALEGAFGGDFAGDFDGDFFGFFFFIVLGGGGAEHWLSSPTSNETPVRGGESCHC